MKYISKNLLLLTTLILSYCQQVEDNNTNKACKLILDNKIHTFDATCIQPANHHIRLENLKLEPSDATANKTEPSQFKDGELSQIKIYAFASSPTAEDGIAISFNETSFWKKPGTIINNQPGHKNDSTASNLEDTIDIKYPYFDVYRVHTNLSTATTWCMDLHNNEPPTHSLLWKGKFCEPGNNSNDDNSVFSSELHPNPEWSGDQSPNGKYFNYRASGKVSLDKLIAGKPLFVE